MLSLPNSKQEILRDEIYCQLLKQLTYTPHPMCEERGWQLLWLAVGLYAPSAALVKQLVQFVRSRHHPVAADCYNRLQKCIR
jgi:myosin-7